MGRKRKVVVPAKESKAETEPDASRLVETQKEMTGEETKTPDPEPDGSSLVKTRKQMTEEEKHPPDAIDVRVHPKMSLTKTPSLYFNGQPIYGDQKVDWPDYPLYFPAVKKVTNQPLPYEVFGEHHHSAKGTQQFLCQNAPNEFLPIMDLLISLRDRPTDKTGEVDPVILRRRQILNKTQFKVAGRTMSAISLITVAAYLYVNDEIIYALLYWYQRRYATRFDNVAVVGTFLMTRYKYPTDPEEVDRPPVFSLDNPEWTQPFGGFCYGKVRTWFKKKFRHKPCPLDWEKIIIFYNRPSSHWFIVAIFPQKQIIEQYDSFPDGSYDELLACFSWLRDECYDQNRPLEDSKWKLYQNRSSVPKQKGGNECGLWSMAFCHAVASGMSMSDIDRDIFTTYCRRSAFSLVYGNLKRQFEAKEHGIKSLIPITEEEATKDQKFLKKKYQLEYFGKRVNPVREGCPVDVNWTDAEGDIWQMQHICASGDLCKRQMILLNSKRRCVVCGFALHAECGTIIQLEAEHPLNYVCLSCEQAFKLGKQVVYPAGGQKHYRFTGDIPKLCKANWQPLCLVRDENIKDIVEPEETYLDESFNIFPQIFNDGHPMIAQVTTQEDFHSDSEPEEPSPEEQSRAELLFNQSHDQSEVHVDDEPPSSPLEEPPEPSDEEDDAEGEATQVQEDADAPAPKTPPKKAPPEEPPSTGRQTRHSTPMKESKTMKQIMDEAEEAEKVAKQMRKAAKSKDIQSPPNSAAGRPPMFVTQALEEVKKAQQSLSDSGARRPPMFVIKALEEMKKMQLALEEKNMQPAASKMSEKTDLGKIPRKKPPPGKLKAPPPSREQKGPPTSDKSDDSTVTEHDETENVDPKKKTSKIRIGKEKLDAFRQKQKEKSIASGTSKLKDPPPSTTAAAAASRPASAHNEDEEEDTDSSHNRRTLEKLRRLGYGSDDDRKPPAIPKDNEVGEDAAIEDEEELGDDDSPDSADDSDGSNGADDTPQDTRVHGGGVASHNPYTGSLYREGMTPAESTFLDDYEEVEKDEIHADRDQQEPRQEFFDKKGKERLKRDLRYTPHGRIEPALNYITDIEYFDCVYDSVNARVQRPRPFEEIPAFYRDLYISRVNNPKKVLGIESEYGQLGSQKDVSNFFYLDKFKRIKKDKTRLIYRMLTNEKNSGKSKQGKQLGWIYAAGAYRRPSLVKECFKRWWNREGKIEFGDALWIPEYGENPFTRKEIADKKKLEYKQKREASEKKRKREFDQKCNSAMTRASSLLKKHKKALEANDPEKKAWIKEMNREFPPERYTDYTEAEHQAIGLLKGKKKTLRLQAIKEVEQLGQLQFVKARGETPAHFKGRVRAGKRWKDCDTSKINPYWVMWNFEELFWGMVMRQPGTWFVIPVGAARKDIAPQQIQTQVECYYQQQDKNYCLVYSLALALHYIGLENEAHKFACIANQANDLDMKSSLDVVTAFMSEIAPTIGNFEAFGRFKKKKKKYLTLRDICEKKTIYPTIVVPLGRDKSFNHAVCVVDDLVFDSTQKIALKLNVETLDWVVGEHGVLSIDGAIRFNCPSIAGFPKLTREMEKNW